MKSIMIVNEDQTTIDNIKSYIKDEDIEIIQVDNSRTGLNYLDNPRRVNLILLNTYHPDSRQDALMILDPKSNLSTNATDETIYLSKPFTKEKFTSFLKDKI